MRRAIAPLCALVACAAAMAAGSSRAFAAPLPGWPQGTRVERVQILGLPAGAGDAARRTMGLPVGGVPDSALVVAGVARLVAALEGEGWLDARIDSIVAGPPAGEAGNARATMLVHTSPGARATLHEVAWEGFERLSPSEAAERSGLAPGVPFRPVALPAALDAVVAAYGARGFAEARLFVIDVGRSAAGVRLALRAIEGDSITVTEVTFPGAVSTRPGVLQKCVEGAVGVPYDPARVRQARQRLADLGVFARVGEPTLESLGGGRARLAFPVVEAATNTFDGALGFQSASTATGGSGGGGLTGRFDLALGSIGGTARQAALQYEGRGGGVTEFRLRYAEPQTFGLAMRTELGLDQQVEDTLYTRTRGALRISSAAWAGARLWLAFARERTVLAEGVVERATAGTFEAGVEADRRDDPLVPRAGYRVMVATGTAFKREALRPDGGRRATQLTALLRTEAHRRVAAASGARLDVDAALRLSNEAVVPYYDLDAVGGARQLRGYREGQFRASRWAVARAEFGLFPATGGRAFAFVDQAVLYRPFLDADAVPSSETLLRTGAGVGLEAPSGLGLVSLSLGWGQGDGPLDGKLHVRIVNRF